MNALVADSLTKTNHHSNRELVAQGVGNIASGIIGGLPGSANTASTVVNIHSGGRRVAGVFYALIMLAVTLGFGRFLADVPIAVLAGVLVKVGYDIIDKRFLVRAFRVRREHLLVMVLTAYFTVFVDLITAVGVGLIVSGMAAARRRGRREMSGVVSVPLLDWTFLYESAAPQREGDLPSQVWLVALRGHFSVASSRQLLSDIGSDIRRHEVVIFDFTDTVDMDDSAAIVVERMIDIAAEEDTASIILGLSGSMERNLRSLNILRRIPNERFVSTLSEARVIVQGLLKN